MNIDVIYETVIDVLLNDCIRIHDRTDRFIWEEYGSPYITRRLDIYIYFNRYELFDSFNYQTVFFKYEE